MKEHGPIVTQPHNNFFLQILSRREKATTFFQRYLPPKILEIANLEQMTFVESQHMSTGGFSLYNDVLYRCPLNNQQMGYFFAVCEHQSTPDKQMPLRLAKYTLAVIEAHLKQKNKTFPIVVHNVLYTGKKKWKYSTAFDDYYAHPEIGAQYLHLAPFNLIQLPKNQNDIIYQDPDLGLYLAAFRSCRDNDPYIGFAKFMEHDWFPACFNKLPAEEKEIIARYIGWCVNKEQYDLEKVLTLITNSKQETEKIMKSVAQQYVEQGVAQGLAQGVTQGVAKGVRQVARDMLFEFHLDLETVKRLTKLSQKDLNQIIQGKYQK